MDFISARLINTEGKREHQKSLIESVARWNGFFELRHGKPYLDSSMSYKYMIEALMRGKGGLIIVSSEHRDFDQIMRHAALVWNDGARYEFDVFGLKSGFCVECRGSTSENDCLGTCADCQYKIINDWPIEPQPISQAFFDRMRAWYIRHGNDDDIEELKALM